MTATLAIPSGRTAVDRIKTLAAALINECDALSAATTPEDKA